MSAWSASTTMNSAWRPLAVRATTHGAIFSAMPVRSGELLWPMAREEAIAPSAATAAATKNNEQKIRRNCDDVSMRFECVVIELPLYRFLLSKPRKFYG